LLKGTLIYYKWRLDGIPPIDDRGRFIVRAFKESDKEGLRDIALRSFSDYFGHYHADELLDDKHSTQVYVDWITNLCACQDDNSRLLVAKTNESLIGFISYRLNSPAECEAVLGGVDPEYRHLGVFTSLFTHGMHWGISKNVEHIIVSTHLQNIAVQKILVRLGFEPKQAYYTFHKHF